MKAGHVLSSVNVAIPKFDSLYPHFLFVCLFVLILSE